MLANTFASNEKIMRTIDREAMMRLVESKPAGKPVREFCKENNLREPQYFYWKNKLNKANQPVPENRFKPIRIKSSIEPKTGLLASLDLPGGAVLSIYDSSIIPSLRQLIGL